MLLETVIAILSVRYMSTKTKMMSLWPSQIGPNRSPMFRFSAWPIDTIANSASSDNIFTLLVLYLGEW